MSNNRQELLNNGAAVGPQGEGRESPSRFPKYPAYKDSGVEWMGEVPAHWNVAPVGMYYKIRNGFPFSADNFSPEGVPEHRLIRIRDILGNDSPLYTDESCPVQCIVENGDILIGMDGDFNIASWAEGKAKLNQRVCAIRGSSFSWDRFFFYGIGAPLKIINDLTFATTVKHLASSQVLKTRFPIPPETEVDNIARFLDYETARIDALIEEQQRLIELLKEKRQAVISHAVTKGLDPTVPMKDSGVEWLGEVPAHWDVARVKNVAKLESGHTPSKDFPEYWEGGEIPWVSLNDSKQLKVTDYIEETQFMITELGVSNSSARLLPARAVVFTRDATIGLAAITTKPMCVSQHLIAWICNENLVLPEYLLLVFYAMEEELDRFTFGATIKTIGMPDIRKLVTPVPPLAEQAQVVAGVIAKRELIDQLIKESNTALSLHLERRSALISAAVTGKIDVRNW